MRNDKSTIFALFEPSTSPRTRPSSNKKAGGAAGMSIEGSPAAWGAAGRSETPAPSPLLLPAATASLVVLRCGVESPSPELPWASPTPARPRRGELLPRGVSAGMVATLQPLFNWCRLVLDTPGEHLTDAGSRRGTLCGDARGARHPPGPSRCIGGAARHAVSQVVPL